jgi:hypothetical protein
MKPHQCEWCGKYAKYEDLDSYTPFGCVNWEAPEPYDPTMLCSKCSCRLYEQYKERFKNGHYGGDWQKSDAELKAARECDLVWVHDHSVTVNGKRFIYQWMPKDLFAACMKEKINKLSK